MSVFPGEVVVVHRRQVVVDERIGVDQLDRRRGRQDGCRIGAGRARGRQAEHRAYPLATCQKRVPHRVGEPRRLRSVAELKPAEIVVDELPKLVRIISHRSVLVGGRFAQGSVEIVRCFAD